MSSRFYCVCVPLQVPSSPISKTAILASVAAFAVMASGPSTGRNGLRCKAAGGPGPLAVTRFVCAHCTATGELSSRGLFLNRASVRRHITASQACHAANLGVREIHVEARAGDVMAGAGGAAGPAPDVRHQPAGTCHLKVQTWKYISTQQQISINARSSVV